jgi:hypothetical protein
MRNICGNSDILCQLKQNGKKEEGNKGKGKTKRTEGINSDKVAKKRCNVLRFIRRLIVV